MKRFLITAGPTREYIDSVRFITNASSGRTGYVIADEAAHRGNEVLLVSGPVSLECPPLVKLLPVVSAEEMARAVLSRLSDVDVLIATAAVCDWKPETCLRHKISKQNGFPDIKWVRTPDVLELAGRQKGNRIHIGFALEDREGREKALRKLSQKNLDCVVLNSPEVMGAESGSYEIVTPGGDFGELRDITKVQLAAILVDLSLEGHDRPA